MFQEYLGGKIAGRGFLLCVVNEMFIAMSLFWETFPAL